MKKCEGCGCAPPPSGPDGTWGMHNYCAHCSMDLCEECMRDRRCRENASGRHEPEAEE